MSCGRFKFDFDKEVKSEKAANYGENVLSQIRDNRLAVEALTIYIVEHLKCAIDEIYDH